MSLAQLVKIKEDKSPSGKIDFTDLTKLGRDAAFVGGAAAASYMLTHVAGLDFGEYTVWLVPLISVGINLLYKWFKDNSPV